MVLNSREPKWETNKRATNSPEEWQLLLRAQNSWEPIKPLLYLPLVEGVEMEVVEGVVEVEVVEFCIYPWWWWRWRW